MLKILFFTFMMAAHPVHVTLLSIEYSAEDHGFNGFLKVYYDDLLLDYKTFTGSSSGPDVKTAPDEAKRLITDYLNGRIKFMAGNKQVMAEIKDMDLSENELRMNLRFVIRKKTRRYVINNSILSDIYRDQSNLLIFRDGDFEEGIKLTPEIREHVFNVK